MLVERGSRFLRCSQAECRSNSDSSFGLASSPLASRRLPGMWCRPPPPSLSPRRVRLRYCLLHLSPAVSRRFERCRSLCSRSRPEDTLQTGSSRSTTRGARWLLLLFGAEMGSATGLGSRWPQSPLHQVDSKPKPRPREPLPERGLERPERPERPERRSYSSWGLALARGQLEWRRAAQIAPALRLLSLARLAHCHYSARDPVGQQTLTLRKTKRRLKSLSSARRLLLEATARSRFV